MLKGVIYDLDGLILDSEGVQGGSIRTILSEFGLARSKNDDSNCKGMRDLEEFDYYKKTYSQQMEGVAFDYYLQRRFEELGKLYDTISMFDGFNELYKDLENHEVLQAVCTSSPRAVFEIACRTFPILGEMGVVVTGDEVNDGKPNPEAYSLAIRRLGLEPYECAGLEDSVNGVKSIVEAGATAVGVTNSFSLKELKEAGAQLIVQGLDWLSYDTLNIHLVKMNSNGHQ
ncbi:MAG: HAD family phosphatase [Nanoarchaeota archaeon]|nr:HAD family phosphatase [Nanoarchaeota archaeon]